MLNLLIQSKQQSTHFLLGCRLRCYSRCCSSLLNDLELVVVGWFFFEEEEEDEEELYTFSRTIRCTA